MSWSAAGGSVVDDGRLVEGGLETVGVVVDGVVTTVPTVPTVQLSPKAPAEPPPDRRSEDVTIVAEDR